MQIAFVIGVVVGAFITWLFMKEARKPRGATAWKDCTYCPDCKNVYNQSGLNASVYSCPDCGLETKTGYVFRYTNDGELEVKSRRR